MARRKTTSTKKTKADRKGAPKPQAGYGDWQSVGATHQRRIIFGSAPQDLRRDLKPYDRLAMVKKCRWAERNSGLFRQILGDMVLYTVGDGIRPQSHAEDAEKAKRYEETSTRRPSAWTSPIVSHSTSASRCCSGRWSGTATPSRPRCATVRGRPRCSSSRRTEWRTTPT